MRIMNEENRLQPVPATAGKLCNGQSFKLEKVGLVFLCRKTVLIVRYLPAFRLS